MLFNYFPSGRFANLPKVLISGYAGLAVTALSNESEDFNITHFEVVLY